MDDLEEELGHAHRLLDEQRWWLDRKSREIVLLRRELGACAEALAFVEQNYPDLTGGATRQTRIDKARALLRKAALSES